MNEFALLEFLYKLGIGSAMIMLNLGIQVVAVVMILRYFAKREVNVDRMRTWRGELSILSVVMLFLFVGHVFQFASWALLFTLLDDPAIPDFGTAFYHSVVNFTSLGYGDIVMSPEWRLLGALEAANGVLMFGLTAGLVLSVLNPLLMQNDDFRKHFRRREPTHTGNEVRSADE